MTYDETSLNDKLLSGPNLTNQLAGVLIRFCIEKVAFMDNIEAMYYQVRVPKEQKSVLRFLWWEDSNLGGNLLYHEMCVHAFGGTSSLGCCNYDLQKTAIDNEVRYGEEAFQTLLHNVYIDDLFKSAETEESAVRLIRDVKAMCQTTDFSLTKFKPNKKVIIQSVPEYDRKNGVKNADLVTSLPIKKGLGIHWDTENDIF